MGEAQKRNDNTTSSFMQTSRQASLNSPASSSTSVDAISTILPPEPLSHEKRNVCTIQIRGDGKAGRRRFDIQKCTMHHLYAFAASVGGFPQNMEEKEPSFKLVTRFPRRVLDLRSSSLKDAGIMEGQEMFIIEHC